MNVINSVSAKINGMISYRITNRGKGTTTSEPLCGDHLLVDTYRLSDVLH